MHDSPGGPSLEKKGNVGNPYPTELGKWCPSLGSRRRANMFITSQKLTSGQCAGVGPGMIFWVAVFRQVDFSGIALHYATLRE